MPAQFTKTSLAGSLHRGDFIDDAHNDYAHSAVLIGSSGTGKTHRPRVLDYRRPCTNTDECAASPRLNRLMPRSRKKPPGSPDRWPTAWFISIR